MATTAAVLTRSYDNARTGANTAETVLTPDLVGRGLRKLFSVTVNDDPRLEAQPLIVPGLRMPDGKLHDVLYVCTMANQVWAFDANDGSQLWANPVSLGTPIRSNHSIDLWGINIAWGILSTPVIDVDTQTMYVVNWSSPDHRPINGTFALHALNIVDGTHRHPPLPIQASFQAGGLQATFKPNKQKQRSALLLSPLAAAGGAKKTLFMACGSTNESDASLHGWVLAFDPATFTQTAAFCPAPKNGIGGVWQAGQGPASDDQGNVYVITGNAAWDGQTDFGNSFLKLTYRPPNGAGAAGSLTLTDWWTPFRNQDRKPAFSDQDLGSGGPVILPGMGIVLGAGKDGVLYVLDQNNLGKAVGTANGFNKLKSPPIFFTYFPGPGRSPMGDLDFLFGNKTHHLHGAPVFWASPDLGPMLFNWGENENLRAWNVDATGKVKFLAKGLEVASAGAPGQGGMPGGMLTLSANGATPHTGVVWAAAPIHGDANRHVVEGILRAYDATQFVTNPDGSKTLKLLWDSKRLAGNRYNHCKFCPPVVWNGKVYMATYDGRVDVYGP